MTTPLALLQDPTLLRTNAYINGCWVPGGQRFAVTDPATGQQLADVAQLTATEAQHAIDAANAAWPAWRKLSGKQRHAILLRWFHLLMQHQDNLARIMTAEQGKPLAEARGEVAYAASFVEWFAEEAKRTLGETLPSWDANKRLLVLRQPIGVCAAITPWNFPLAMITRKVAPALAAGCPVVIKPAELTPLSALAAAELAHRAGIPAGGAERGHQRRPGQHCHRQTLVRKRHRAAPELYRQHRGGPHPDAAMRPQRKKTGAGAGR